MWDYRGPGTISETRLDMLTACSQIGKNLVGYISAMLSVKAGTLLIPVGFTLSLLSRRLLRRSRLGLSLIGVAYLVGKAAVWATFDDRRFIVVPEVLLFILAAVELGHWSICWPGESSEQARNKAALNSR